MNHKFKQPERLVSAWTFMAKENQQRSELLKLLKLWDLITPSMSPTANAFRSGVAVVIGGRAFWDFNGWDKYRKQKYHQQNVASQRKAA